MIEGTSIVGDRQDSGVVFYKCLQKDVNNLPKDIPTGSTCYVIDTGDFLMFEATTEQWFAQ